MINKTIDKVIGVLFDKRKQRVLGVFILGFILRFIAARNIGVSADDVIHAYKSVGIFNSGKLVIWDQSTSLWYYIVNILSKPFGSSIVATRFATVLFGSLLIIIVYIFVKKVFKSDRAALISSFLVAVSPLIIRETLPEMDNAAIFFTILAAYFIFSYLQEKKTKDLILTFIILGVGVMIKLYVAFFAVSFIIFLAISEYKSHKDYKKVAKVILLVSVILFVLCLPTFSHNYLLYKDKGFMDFIFSNTFGIRTNETQQLYGWAAGWNLPTDYFGFFFGNQQNFDPTPIPGFLIVLSFLFKGDPTLFILGFLGLIYAYKYYRKYFWFFLAVFIPAFIYLGAQIPMAKHFIWVIILVSPLAGLLIEDLSNKIPRIKLRYLLILFLIFNLLYLGVPKEISPTNAHFYGQSSFGQLVSYKSNIASDALVVADSRIYRGNIHFALMGTNYMEAASFTQAANELNARGNLAGIDVYYIECAIDDCGWGTIKDQPELNQSMEEFTKLIANVSQFSINLTGPNPYKYYLPFFKNGRADYTVYKVRLALNPGILQVAKQTHIWWLYPENYDRKISAIFDDYYTYNAFDNLLNKLAWLILCAEIALSLLAIIYIGYLFINE